MQSAKSINSKVITHEFQKYTFCMHICVYIISFPDIYREIIIPVVCIKREINEMIALNDSTKMITFLLFETPI